MGKSPGELREARQEIINLQSDSATGPLSSADFYYMSGFRDLLCHVHEVSFDPLELKALLKSVGLTPLGYRAIKLATRAKYLERFPQDPYMRDLDLVNIFEFESPELLHLGLQVLWVQGK
jgi:hypothetical protein